MFVINEFVLLAYFSIIPSGFVRCSALLSIKDSQIMARHRDNASYAKKYQEVEYVIEKLYTGTFEAGDFSYNGPSYPLVLYQEKSLYEFEPNRNALLFTIGKSKEDKILQFWSFEIESYIYYGYSERQLSLIRWDDGVKKTLTLVFAKNEDVKRFYKATLTKRTSGDLVVDVAFFETYKYLEGKILHNVDREWTIVKIRKKSIGDKNVYHLTEDWYDSISDGERSAETVQLIFTSDQFTHTKVINGEKVVLKLLNGSQNRIFILTFYDEKDAEMFYKTINEDREKNKVALLPTEEMMILFGNDVLQAEKHEEIVYSIEKLYTGTFETGDTLHDASSYPLFLYQDTSSYKFEPNVNAVLFTIGKSKEDKILQFWSFEIESCIYYEYFERKLRLIRLEDDSQKTVTLVFSKTEDARAFFRATRTTTDRTHALADDADLEIYELSTGKNLLRDTNQERTMVKIDKKSIGDINVYEITGDQLMDSSRGINRSDTVQLIFTSDQFTHGDVINDRTIMIQLLNAQDYIFILTFYDAEDAEMFYEEIDEDREKHNVPRLPTNNILLNWLRNKASQAKIYRQSKYVINDLYVGTENGVSRYNASSYPLFLYQDKYSYEFEKNRNAILFTVGKSKDDDILHFWSFEIESCIYYEYFQRKLSLIWWENDSQKIVTLVFSNNRDARNFYKATRTKATMGDFIVDIDFYKIYERRTGKLIDDADQKQTILEVRKKSIGDKNVYEITGDQFESASYSGYSSDTVQLIFTSGQFTHSRVINGTKVMLRLLNNPKDYIFVLTFYDEKSADVFYKQINADREKYRIARLPTNRMKAFVAKANW